MRLTGKRILVTGGSQGLGLAAACGFAAEGASVMLCARSARDLETARWQAERAAADGAIVRARTTDVSDPAQVDRLVEAAVEELGGIDVLFANAGVYGPKGPVDEVDLEDWVRAVTINLMGVVYSCRSVLPHLKAQQAGTIIVLGGGGATKPMPFFSAYAASKAGVVRFAETLAIEVAEHGITVNVVAPGALNTRLLDEVLEAGPEKVGRSFYEASCRQRQSGGDSVDRAVALCVHLASPAAARFTGKLISAKWDPWEEFEAHREDLDSDIYTLRRIVPADRGKSWGDA